MAPAVGQARTTVSRLYLPTMTPSDDTLSAPYDWNAPPLLRRQLDVADTTLSDGLESPSVVDPTLNAKRRLLSLMPELGIRSASLGQPGSGPRQFTDALELARELVRAQWPLDASCDVRATVKDVSTAIDVRERSGLDLEVAISLPASPIRLEAEGITEERRNEVVETSIAFAVRAGARVVAVFDDASRTPPHMLAPLLRDVVALGVSAVRLTDSSGRALPDGTRSMVRFVSEQLRTRSGRAVRLEWHGQQDRGLAMANALAALDAGADRLLCSALGLGPRAGTVPTELLLTNLVLLGIWPYSLRSLAEYCESAAAAFGVAIPAALAIVGADAFRTATGAQASVLVKAMRAGDPWLADNVVSGVPASLFGVEHHIDVSPVSGLSNVRWWLSQHGYDASDLLLTRELLLAVKRTQRAASDAELHELVASLRSSRLVQR
jgi:2-isopropylmalate synthase